jgi:predicted O-methyltransferase YrrM
MTKAGDKMLAGARESLAVARGHNVLEKTKDNYARVFDAEREIKYPAVKELEKRFNYAIDRTKMEHAARYLCCPIKMNPPNWQHGRVIYATVRKRLEGLAGENVTLLDIGTAKGFSALCALWALKDSGVPGTVYSVDVIDPDEAIARNGPLDLEGPLTLKQTLARWPEADAIHFKKSTGIGWLEKAKERVHFAFIDGKHVYEAVREELKLLATLQQPGDVIVVDDLQIPGVRRAVDEGLGTNGSAYDVQTIEVLPNRCYGIAWRAR